jgi:hypothetical protein
LIHLIKLQLVEGGIANHIKTTNFKMLPLARCTIFQYSTINDIQL